ncbi:MAG: thiol:disulfide interchange protein [Verrucomicrobiales bacterium]|jgi:thiol:disulfide interchange protein
MMLADMTSPNALYDEALFALGSSGIPYNLLVTPNGPSIEFPTIVTQGVMREALEQAAVK